MKITDDQIMRGLAAGLYVLWVGELLNLYLYHGMSDRLLAWGLLNIGVLLTTVQYDTRLTVYRRGVLRLVILLSCLAQAVVYRTGHP